MIKVYLPKYDKRNLDDIQAAMSRAIDLLVPFEILEESLATAAAVARVAGRPDAVALARQADLAARWVECGSIVYECIKWDFDRLAEQLY